MGAPDTKLVPAIGYSLVCTFAPDRQITFQHFIGADESDEVVNANIDRILRFTDRLRTRYQIPDMKAERDKLRDEVSQAEQDLGEADINYNKAQAALDEQILELERVKKEQFDGGYEEFRRAGRQGSYIPKGQTKSTIDRANQGIEGVLAQKQKHQNERDQFRGNVELNIKRRKDRIALLDEQIAEAEKVT